MIPVTFKTVLDLLDYFKDEQVCCDYLEKQRWGDTVSCYYCKCSKVYKTTRGYKCSNIGCQKTFSVRIGSIYENSRLPLRIWFAAMYLMLSGKEAISSCHIAKDLGITQKTAWYLKHRIRKMVREKRAKVLQSPIY